MIGIWRPKRWTRTFRATAARRGPSWRPGAALERLEDRAVPSAVGWWRAEGDAFDSAQGHDGILVNVVPPATGYGPGRVGQAFSFDGVDDFVAVPDEAALDLTGDLTIEAWVNPSTIVGDQRVIVSKRSPDNTNVNYAFYLEQDGSLAFASRSSGAWSIAFATNVRDGHAV